jgi:hypothetical protein
MTAFGIGALIKSDCSEGRLSARTGRPHQNARYLVGRLSSHSVEARYAGQQEEIWRLHTPHLHQPEHSVVVNLTEMIDYGVSAIDYDRAALLSKVQGSQACGGTVGAEKEATSGEGHPDRSAAGESGPTQGDADRHEPRVERDDLTGAGSKQQRMNPVNAVERLSIPAQRLKNTIQRMSRRQSSATPSPDQCLRLHARHGIEARERVLAGDWASPPSGKPAWLR